MSLIVKKKPKFIDTVFPLARMQRPLVKGAGGCFLFALLFTLITTASAQNYQTFKDPKNGQLTFKGTVTREELTAEPTFTWLQPSIDEYRPKKKKIKFLKEHLTPAGYSIVVFLGTWCGDTHDMLPQLFKVLQQINYPASRLTMYGVERDKTNRGEEVKKYAITNIPTIILLKDNIEVGRITETVNKSVEVDLVKIIGH